MKINFDLDPNAPNRLDQLFSFLMRAGKSTSGKTTSDATKRQRTRIRAHTAKWTDVPSAEKMTRQRIRREQMLRFRQGRTLRKAEHGTKNMGGSAVIG